MRDGKETPSTLTTPTTSQIVRPRARLRVGVPPTSMGQLLKTFANRDGTMAAVCGRMGHERFRPLRNRSFAFALDVTRLCRTLPATWEGRRAGDQLFRAGTSVAANYRAASCGRSPADFIAKMGTVVEEADESEFWLTFIKPCPLRTTRTSIASLENPENFWPSSPHHCQQRRRTCRKSGGTPRRTRECTPQDGGRQRTLMA